MTDLVLKLNDCYFCAQPVVLDEYEPGNYHVLCETCHSCGPLTQSKLVAISSWNNAVLIKAGQWENILKEIGTILEGGNG